MGTSSRMLEVQSLRRVFGSIVAVDSVSFTVETGEFKSLIGPNGAGKTTLFNMITGNLPPTDGRITLNGDDITGLEPHQIARKGCARSFQVTSIFPGLSVRENIRVMAQANSSNRMSPFRPKNSVEEPLSRSDEVMELLDLTELAERPASELSHGQQRMLEIGLTLAIDPEILLFDEPTAGMSQNETREMIELLDDLKSEYTIFLVEHDMDVVMSLSDRISVLHYGNIIDEGSPDDIRNSEVVNDAYFGGDEIYV